MCPRCAAEGLANLLPWAGMLSAAAFMSRASLALAASSLRARLRNVRNVRSLLARPLLWRRGVRARIDGA